MDIVILAGTNICFGFSLHFGVRSTNEIFSELHFASGETLEKIFAISFCDLTASSSESFSGFDRSLRATNIFLTSGPGRSLK
ncbi:MAG: hypothetical protein HC799_19455 [Limnothrix sp. RL_2_0]|nr:hypothetical protein [Limnothrix sp. RL_2_0]